MERGGVNLIAVQQRTYPLAHLGGGSASVGQGKNLIRTSMAMFHKMRRAIGQDRGFSRPCASHHQHGTVQVLDGLSLTIIGNKGGRTGISLGHSHYWSEYHPRVAAVRTRLD